MKTFVQRSGVSSNDFTHLVATIGVFAFGAQLVLCGCVGMDAGERVQKLMLNNSSTWDRTYAQVPVAQKVSALPEPGAPGVRRIPLAWDAERPVGPLIEAMKRVTYHGRDLEPLIIGTDIPSEGKVRGLVPSQQDALRHLWTSRIVLALTTKYYDTSKELLEQGLRKGDLVIYYFLVGRNNSPEMGHADMIEMLCLNSDGQVVSRVNKRYGASYPLGFVDREGTPSDVLF